MDFSIDISKILLENFSEENWGNGEGSVDDDVTSGLVKAVKSSTKTSYFFKWCHDHIGEADIIVAWVGCSFIGNRIPFTTHNAHKCIEYIDALRRTSNGENSIRIKYEPYDPKTKKRIYSIIDKGGSVSFQFDKFPFQLWDDGAIIFADLVNIFSEDEKITSPMFDWCPWWNKRAFFPGYIINPGPNARPGDGIILRIKIKDWTSFYNWWKTFTSHSRSPATPDFVYFSDKCPRNIFSGYPLMQKFSDTRICCIDGMEPIEFHKDFAEGSNIIRLEIPHVYIPDEPNSWPRIFSDSFYGSDVDKNNLPWTARQAYQMTPVFREYSFSRLHGSHHFGSCVAVVIWNKYLASVLGTAESDTRLIRKFERECFNIKNRDKRTVWAVG